MWITVLVVCCGIFAPGACLRFPFSTSLSLSLLTTTRLEAEDAQKRRGSAGRRGKTAGGLLTAVEKRVALEEEDEEVSDLSTSSTFKTPATTSHMETPFKGEEEGNDTRARLGASLSTVSTRERARFHHHLSWGSDL